MTGKLVRREYEGTHFYVSLDGEEIGMSQQGLADFTGVAESSMRLFISEGARNKSVPQELRSLLLNDFTLAGAEQGGKVKLIPADVCVRIIEYFAFEKDEPKAKYAFRKFATMGFKTWVLQVTNHQVVKPLSRVESLKALREDLDKLIRIEQYAEDKPGMENILEYAKDEDNQDVLPGLVTVEDVLERLQLQVSGDEKKVIGMYAATAYRNLTGKKPPEIDRKYKQAKNNKWQCYKVAAYPLDFVPVIENAVQLGFNS